MNNKEYICDGEFNCAQKVHSLFVHVSEFISFDQREECMRVSRELFGKHVG